MRLTTLPTGLLQRHRRVPAIAAAVLAAVSATAVLNLTGLGGPTVAHAAVTSDPSKVGLYGAQDPTFDGVYRQSLSILALVAAGQTPAPAAVTWLKKQQCTDGGFESFRTPLTAACLPPSSTAFDGEDSNSTGIAVQALAAIGDTADASRAVGWLGTHLNSDGGWAYYPDGAAGNASDANSTSLGLSAFYTLGRALPKTSGNVTPLDFLASLQVGCSGTAATQGAFTFFGSANDYATVQAALAVVGGFLPVHAATIDNTAPVLPCPITTLTPAQSGDAAAGYLIRRMAANGHSIPDSTDPTKIDDGSTANAVLALVRIGHGAGAVSSALGVLATDQLAFTHVSGLDVPGALADLTMAAVAGGESPAGFGGTNLVSRLAATITTAAPKPKPTPTPTVKPVPTTTPATSGTGNPGTAVDAETLPRTGPGNGAVPLTAAGLILIAAGTALVGGTRRRRRSREVT
jgi:LPXTG-motif cell wall-anchored protein